MTFQILFAVLFGYALGSIPFGLIFAYVLNLGDLRNIGSGNIGATNVLRTGNKLAAALTLLCDGGKGALAVWFVQYHFDLPPLSIVLFAAAFASFLGHVFPVWLKFKGGKGVATSLGLLLYLYWPIGIAVCLTWLLTAKIFKYSSLSALVALGVSPLYAMITMNVPFVLFCLMMALFVAYTHKENIDRLRKGKENKI